MPCSCFFGGSCPIERTLRQVLEEAQGVLASNSTLSHQLQVSHAAHALHTHRRLVQAELFEELTRAQQRLRESRTDFGEQAAFRELQRVEDAYGKAMWLASLVAPWRKLKGDQDAPEGTRPGETPESAMSRWRRRYHAVLADVVPEAWARDDCRHALHQAHPQLPDSERSWRLDHYLIAVEALSQYGTALVDRALQLAAQRDPATEDELLILSQAAWIVEGEGAVRISWYVKARVGEWVRREIARITRHAA
jgi:hypothetical protein